MIAEIVGIDYIMPYILGMFLIFSVGYFISSNMSYSTFASVIGLFLMLISGFAVLDALLFMMYGVTHPTPQGEIIKVYINGTAKLDNGTIVNLSSFPFVK
jgi:hypothetical protein